jgi:hypothetical protein
MPQLSGNEPLLGLNNSMINMESRENTQSQELHNKME